MIRMLNKKRQFVLALVSKCWEKRVRSPSCVPATRSECKPANTSRLKKSDCYKSPAGNVSAADDTFGSVQFRDLYRAFGMEANVSQDTLVMAKTTRKFGYTDQTLIQRKPSSNQDYQAVSFLWCVDLLRRHMDILLRSVLLLMDNFALIVYVYSHCLTIAYSSMHCYATMLNVHACQ